MKKLPEFIFKGKQLNPEQSRILLGCIMATKDASWKESVFDEEPTLCNNMAAKIISKRINVYGLAYKLSSSFFAMSLLTMLKTPGDCMILLRLCHQYHKKTGKTFLDINDWCEMFPFGVPTEDEKQQWWESQKIPYEDRPAGSLMDNLVDIPELWK
jgi:hypothetical protein